MTNRPDDPSPARPTDPELVRIMEGWEFGGCAPSLDDIKYLLASTDPWAEWWSRGLPDSLQEYIDAACDAANEKYTRDRDAANEKYTPNDAYGENHNIGAAFTLPPDMVTLTPKGPELPEFSYRQDPTTRDERLSWMIETAHLGSFEIALTLTEADYVSANLYAMLRELPSIRQRWAAQQEGGTR